MADEAFKERIGRNEATFRSVNEGIDRGRPTTDSATLVGFVCECGHLDCRRVVDLTPAEYAEVRSHDRRFLIVPGHEIPAAERVVERHERYAIVEKQ